ncbi:hypothetical protein JVU11DRAFT_12296 [Chiua virens]|nr:hypothetical protein JVU11DRAFT_12296 [Chiua virens]
MVGAGDSVNFTKKHFNNATQHLKTKFPNQQGGEKNGASCQTKWTSLKEEYFAVVNLKAALGFTWSDNTGAGKGKSHKHASRFRNKGFLVFEIIAEMMPLEGQGLHVFCPGGKHHGGKSVLKPSDPAPSSDLLTPPASDPFSKSVIPSAPAATTTQAVVSGSQAIFSPACDVSTPPSVPSSFLQASDCGSNGFSGVLTSISWGKRKVSTLSGCESIISGPRAPGSSDPSRLSKHVCGPSMAAAAQAENAKTMKQLTSTVEQISNSR